ncbi:MAG: S16 family serine protease [bacterium]|nr:S16 family serine protease [bacterium]
MKTIKQNYKYILVFLGIFLLFTFKFPYYIDAPGGISDVSSKVILDSYKSKGTFNLAYVKEYNASIPTLLFSLFNKDYKIISKKDVLLDNETSKTYELRDKLLMDESISNATYVAYKKANKKIEEVSNKLIVTYIDKKSKSNLEVNDEILAIDNIPINSKEDITNIVESKNYNDKLKIKVKNKDHEYERYAYIINDDNSKKIEILISNIKEFKTIPKINFNIDKNESGPSGGVITALYIYDSLIKEDLTKGKTIVGTGTIELDGTVGSIGGVSYKLKSAVKSGADIFLVPNDENYTEAIKLKKQNNYDIKIVGISNIDDAIDYLKNM